MIIELQRAFPGVVVKAVNPEYDYQIRKHMQQMCGPNEDGTAFIQDVERVPDYIDLSPKQLHQLQSGWIVRIRRDAWTALHIWGYDAHTLAERGLVK